jgi:hypothetical protein
MPWAADLLDPQQYPYPPPELTHGATIFVHAPGSDGGMVCYRGQLVGDAIGFGGSYRAGVFRDDGGDRLILLSPSPRAFAGSAALDPGASHGTALPAPASVAEYGRLPLWGPY